jgi:hypothetical protein
LGNSIKQTDTKLPNFLIAGAAKSGTTSLYYYLKQHPDVFMSAVKEPKFFSGYAANPGEGPGDDPRWNKFAGGVSSFDDYVKLFRMNSGQKAVGEASVDTIYYCERTIPAIKSYLGDPRIIVILRDPVKRAYSAYNFLVRDGYEKLSFENALIAEEQGMRNKYSFIWQYRKCGLYADQVRAFQENFSRVKVLLYDDLKGDVISLVQSVYAFLDINSAFVPNTEQRHNTSSIPRWRLLNDLFMKPKRLHKVARKIGGAVLGMDRWIRFRDGVRAMNMQKPLPMDPEIKQKLMRFYRDDILKLQEYIGRDLSAWLKGEDQ